MRDLCLLLCPADSPERAAAQGASSDDDLRSALYLLRNSEPCPTCTARVQRDADAAGCPNVTCPICRTTFRCFCVVGDPPVGTFACEFRPTALSMPARVRVSALLRALANVAEDAERERRKLAMLASYDGHGWADGCGLADVFNFFAGTQALDNFGRLKRAAPKTCRSEGVRLGFSARAATEKVLLQGPVKQTRCCHSSCSPLCSACPSPFRGTWVQPASCVGRSRHLRYMAPGAGWETWSNRRA